MSHSSHNTCFSGASRPPQIWQAHLRHGLFSSSLQYWQDGPLFPVFRRAGGAAAGYNATRDCHPHPGTLRARPRLTSRGATNQGAPLIRELNLQDFIHKYDPTVVELRIIPAEHHKTLAHYGAEPGCPSPLVSIYVDSTIWAPGPLDAQEFRPCLPPMSLQQCKLLHVAFM